MDDITRTSVLYFRPGSGISEDAVDYMRRVDLVLSGEYLKVHPLDYLIDKSMSPARLADDEAGMYNVMLVEPIPGGLVDTADEQWYYTLYKIEKTAN